MNDVLRVDFSKKFQKSVTRIKKTSKPSTATRIQERLEEAVNYLINRQPLPPSFRDHGLENNRKYRNCRDCHILGDLVLLYRIEGDTCTLLLLDLDTHSNLFEGAIIYNG